MTKTRITIAAIAMMLPGSLGSAEPTGRGVIPAESCQADFLLMDAETLRSLKLGMDQDEEKGKKDSVPLKPSEDNAGFDPVGRWRCEDTTVTPGRECTGEYRATIKSDDAGFVWSSRGKQTCTMSGGGIAQEPVDSLATMRDLKSKHGSCTFRTKLWSCRGTYTARDFSFDCNRDAGIFRTKGTCKRL